MKKKNLIQQGQVRVLFQIESKWTDIELQYMYCTKPVNNKLKEKECEKAMIISTGQLFLVYCWNKIVWKIKNDLHCVTKWTTFNVLMLIWLKYFILMYFLNEVHNYKWTQQ